MYVKFETSKNVLWITISRADRLNAIGTEVSAEFENQIIRWKKVFWDSIAKNSESPEFRAIVLTSSSVNTKKGAFAIAGGDLKELQHLKDRNQCYQYAKQVHDFCSFLEEIPIPTLAFFDGALIGGGAELALSSDQLYLTEESYFQFKQHQVGLPSGYGGGLRLLEAIGYKKSYEVYLMGEKITSREALRLGMVNKVLTDHHNLKTFVNSVLDKITNYSYLVLKAQKKMLTAARKLDRQKILSEELDLFCSTWRNSAHEAFLKKFNR